MIELLLLLPIAILGFLLWEAQRRHDEAEKAWRAERAGLLNRIQAPEIELAKQFEAPEEPAYVGWDDDEAFADYKRGLTNGGS